MKKRNFSRRAKASMMSLIMAVSCVPASMVAFTAGAVNVASPAIILSANKKGIDETTVTEMGAPIAVGEKYLGYTADVASKNLKTINITFTPDFTGKMSCGFGIGISSSPYWLEYDANKGFIDSKGGTVDIAATEIACKEGEPVTVGFDLSKLKLKYDPETSEYPGEFEFRNYYTSVKGGTITVDDIEANGKVAVPPKPSDDNGSGSYTPPVENVKHNNNVTNKNNWSFKDNKDGTATISSTVARQIDFSDNPIILTQGYDDESYAAEGIIPTEEDPINSHKFSYSDFGITDMQGVTIESLTAIIESDEEVDVFMYGGGLNVKQASPADTEYAKKVAGIPGKETASYWYNDSGADAVANDIAQGVKYEIEPAEGSTLVNAGTYIKAYWEVPVEVKPYESTKLNDQISFQYWYGSKVEKEDNGEEEESPVETYADDAEDTENPDTPDTPGETDTPDEPTTPDEPGEESNLVESVKLTGAIITYTKEVIVPYTKSVSTKVNEMLEYADTEKNALHVSYADLGIDEDMDVYAIRFDITATSDIDKLVYNMGTGVTAEAKTEDEYWYQESGDYCVVDAGKSVQIMWILPPEIAGPNNATNFVDPNGEIYFGYYYGEADAIKINNVEVYYNVETTTTTTTKTTTTTTTTETTTSTTTTSTSTTSKTTTSTTSTTKATTQTTTSTTESTTTTTTTATEPPLTVTMWGDANVDNQVNIADAVRVMQNKLDSKAYPISEQGLLNADIIDNDEHALTAIDALGIQAVSMKSVEQESLPITSLELYESLD